LSATVKIVDATTYPPQADTDQALPEAAE